MKIQCKLFFSLILVLITIFIVFNLLSCGSHSSSTTTTTTLSSGGAQTGDSYDMGSPTLKDIWVSPTSGNDSNTGNDRSHPLRTFNAAWNSIPSGGTLTTTGYRIQLMPGTYSAYDAAIPNVPGQLDTRYGTYQFPIIIQAADGEGTVILPGLQINDCRYIYLINLNTIGACTSGDGFHISSINYLLIRNCVINGNNVVTGEVLKGNQCKYVYVEDSEICNTNYNVALDFVAVQYGHILRNKIHDAEDWCMYLKGGSAYFRIEGNELYNANNGGFSAGQATGFGYMVSPWVHYEAYDIKFVNNIIHDTDGAGMGVNGGYNILLAYNTLYRTGQNSHAIEVMFGGRSCESDASHISSAQANHDAGGWGRAVVGGSTFYIPNRNIYIYNNIVYNPTGYQSAWSHFSTRGEGIGENIPPAGTNVPTPVRADTNLVVKGNFIWNGTSGLALGVGDTGEANLVPATVRAENTINVAIPQLTSPGAGNFTPVTGGNVFSATIYSIPNFSWTDAPTPPTVPAGTNSNAVNHNYSGTTRGSHPGAM